MLRLDYPSPSKVRIHELTKMDEAENSGAFFKDVQSELVTTVNSDRSGFFQVSLPPGRYSVFVEVFGDYVYANRFDGDGNINPVQVMPDSVVKAFTDLDYNKAF